MSGANGVHTGGRHEARTMDYFDNLPRSVRAVVASARFDWATCAWLRMFERGQITAKDLVKRVQRLDAELAAKERRRVWGNDYPVLKGELANAPRQPKKQRARR